VEERRLLKAGQSKQNLRIGVAEGLLATPWVILSIPGGFILAALLTQHFGIGPGMFGLIASMPAWANALQIFFLPGLARFLDARDVALSLSWLNLGLWIMLMAILPFLPQDQPAQVGWVFILFFIFASASASLVGVGWTAWVQSWVPERIRGSYFGQRNRYIQIATVTFFLLALLLFSGWLEGVRPFQVLIGLAVGLRFFSILWQHRIVDRGETVVAVPGQSWWSELRKLAGVRDFRLFVLFVMWCSFWIGALGPFSVLFTFEYLEFSRSQFAALAILATASGALLMPFWGRMIDRRGCLTCIFWSLIMWWSTGYIPAFLGPETAWILYLAWFVGGAAAGGFLMGVFTLLFKVIPKGMTTAGISLNTAATSLTAALGPLALGWLLSRAEWLGFSEEWLYRGAFIVGSTLILSGSLLLGRIREPRRDGVFSLMGAMRGLRLSILSHSFAFVANTTTILKTPRRPRSPEGKKDLSDDR